MCRSGHLHCSDELISEECMKLTLMIRRSKTDRYGQGKDVLIAMTGDSIYMLRSYEDYGSPSEVAIRGHAK